MWATVFIFMNTFAIAIIFVPITAESSMWETFLSLFTAFFIVTAAAVFNTFIILRGAIESWSIATWLVFWEAFSVAIDISWFATQIVGGWLTVLGQVWAANGVFIFTTALRISIVFFLIQD